METRVYVINTDLINDLSPALWGDEEFMKEAEEQGSVYTLQGFSDAFNSNGPEINMFTDMIRFLKVDIADSIIEINELELASEIAHIYMCEKMKVNPDDIDNTSIYNQGSYTEVAQDIYNQEYDEILEIISNIKI